MNKNDYIVESLQYNNLICLKKNLLNEIQNKDIKTIYDEGYKNKTDRIKLFPWNKNVDCLLNMDTNEAVNFLNEHFNEYKNKYTLYINKN